MSNDINYNNISNIQNDLIANGNIPLNKGLLQNFGVNAAIIYAELLNKFIYYYSTDQLTDDGYFYYTIPQLKKNTSLGRKQQDKAIEKLINAELIFKDLKSVPPKRHFKLNDDYDAIKGFLMYDKRCHDTNCP